MSYIIIKIEAGRDANPETIALDMVNAYNEECSQIGNPADMVRLVAAKRTDV